MYVQVSSAVASLFQKYSIDNNIVIYDLLLMITAKCHTQNYAWDAATRKRALESDKSGSCGKPAMRGIYLYVCVALEISIDNICECY